MISLGSQRTKFDVPANIAYFNTAYNAPLLNNSRDALHAAAGAKSRPWERAPSDFFDGAERVRMLAAELFGASPDHYAIVPAASYGISTAARAIEPGLGPSDEILLLAEEFPSNVLPWRRICGETGCAIRTVETPRDGDWTRAVLARLDRKVRVAALSAVHWTNGARIDLVQIADACRAIGAMLVLDVTQSLGAVPLDLARIRPDFMVAAGYKWLLAPYGFSLLYVASEWHDARPLEETWLARAHSENFARLVEYQDCYKPGARRFDVGETCVTTVIPGAIAALEQLRAWTIPAIAEALGQITADIAHSLSELGFTMPSETTSSPHMIGIDLPGGYSGDLVGFLRERAIYISQRGNAMRIAPHLHVTQDDVAALVAGCAAAVGRTS